MDACPAGDLVAIGTRHRVIKLIDFQHATLQACAAVSPARCTACRVTVAQDHVAPLGCHECVAFSPDASMVSCVSNSEVMRRHRADVCRPLSSPLFCRFGPGTCAARHRLFHLLGVLCVVSVQSFCAVCPVVPSAFPRVMLIGSGTLPCFRPANKRIYLIQEANKPVYLIQEANKRIYLTRGE